MRDYLRFDSEKKLREYFCNDCSRYLFTEDNQKFIRKDNVPIVYPVFLKLYYNGGDCNSVGLGYEYRVISKKSIEEIVDNISTELDYFKNILKGESS